jgi:hypothetical protein
MHLTQQQENQHFIQNGKLTVKYPSKYGHPFWPNHGVLFSTGFFPYTELLPFNHGKIFMSVFLCALFLMSHDKMCNACFSSCPARK